MGVLAHVKDLFILSSIFGLIGVGLVIALNSGVVAIGRERCRSIRENASSLFLALTACLAFLMMAQQVAGVRFAIPW